MKKIYMLALIAFVMGAYLLWSPRLEASERPVSHVILEQKLDAPEGIARFAKKLQPHIDALEVQWKDVVALEKNVKEQVADFEKNPSEDLKAELEKAMAEWKKATETAGPLAKIVEAGRNALAHPEKVVALANQLEKGAELLQDDLELLEKIAEICLE